MSFLGEPKVEFILSNFPATGVSIHRSWGQSVPAKEVVEPLSGERREKRGQLYKAEPSFRGRGASGLGLGVLLGSWGVRTRTVTSCHVPCYPS